MPDVNWPAGVRTSVRRDGFRAPPPKNVLRSEMERGAKQRLTSTGSPRPFVCRMRLPDSERILFEAWTEPGGANPGGALFFTFPDPLTGNTRRSRFVAQEGVAYQLEPDKGGSWMLSFTLEVFPA